MTLIRIINGTYGHRPEGAKHIEAKTPTDGSFMVTDAEAKRLIGLKVAVLADDTVGGAVSPRVGDVNITASTNQTDQEIGTDGDERQNTANAGENAPDYDVSEIVQEYNTDMPASDLRDMLKNCGISFKFGMSKADMVEALDKYFGETVDDDEAPPSVGFGGLVTEG